MRTTRTTKRKLKRKVPFVICAVLLLTLLAGCGVLLKDFFMPNNAISVYPADPNEPEIMLDRLNVLLLGIDARGEKTITRTDTMILASVDQKTKQVAFLSIPRDTRVNIPGRGMDKINSASVYGGPELSLKTVSQLFGTQIDNYVLVDFNGFKNIVDALGGITYTVERDMYHWDNEDNYAYQIDLKKGEQLLDGDKALQYVRYRSYAMGDIDRTYYQQKFLVALAKETLKAETIPKLPKLISEINRHVKTNLSLTELYKLASVAKSLEDSNFVAQTLPGRPVDINGSYWAVDPAEAKKTLAKVFNGETETNVVLSTPLSGYSSPAPTQSTPEPTEQEQPEQSETETDGQTKTDKDDDDSSTDKTNVKNEGSSDDAKKDVANPGLNTNAGSEVKEDGTTTTTDNNANTGNNDDTITTKVDNQIVDGNGAGGKDEDGSTTTSAPDSSGSNEEGEVNLGIPGAKAKT